MYLAEKGPPCGKEIKDLWMRLTFFDVRTLFSIGISDTILRTAHPCGYADVSVVLEIYSQGLIYKS